MHRKLVILVAFLGCALGGCAGSRGTTDFSVADGEYAEAFAAAKDVLVAMRFDLDQVDARNGVITTRAKQTSGLATPWDVEQSGLSSEWEDLINRHMRRVRIDFRGPADAGDLRETTGPVTGRVQATIDRVRRPGWRLETTSVRLSSFARDPDLTARGMQPNYVTSYSLDPDLAKEIAARVRSRLAAP